MNARRKVLKKWVRCSLLIIILAIFLISIKMIYDSFSITSGQNVIYAYNIRQNIDYKVYLYDNSFIDSEYIEKDELYMADLIENIGISFHYNYSGSKVVPVTYEYDIKGTINASYQKDESNDNNIWKKEYTLLNTQTGQISDVNNININEKLDFDYGYYDDIVSNFRKELKLPIDATFDIIMTINMFGQDDLLGKLVDTQVMKLRIPLNSVVFKIDDSYEPIINKNIMSQDEIQQSVNIKRIICGILVGIVGIVLFIGLFDKIFNLKSKNPYECKLNKILKEYGDVIVEIINQTNINDLNVVEVKGIDEMIDLEEELRIPIMFYEINEGYLGEFTLIHGNIIYKYILDNSPEK